MDNMSTEAPSTMLMGTWYLVADVPNLIVLVLIAVLGLGNLGVIICFIRTKTLRKPFNYIVIGMAAGNFVMSDITSMMEIVLVLRKFVSVGAAWCHIQLFLRTFSFSQSMMFIALVAVLRARILLAKKPIHLSLNTIFITVTIVYVLSIIWAAVWVLPSSGNISLCMGNIGQASRFIVLMFITITLFFFFLTLISYVVLSIGLRCRHAQTTFITGSKKSEILIHHAAVTVSVIFVVCFCIPFLPFLIPFYKFLPLPHVLHIYNLFISLACAQSALNPYVYLATNSHFRKVFRRTFRSMFHNRVDAIATAATAGNALQLPSIAGSLNNH